MVYMKQSHVRGIRLIISLSTRAVCIPCAAMLVALPISKSSASEPQTDYAQFSKNCLQLALSVREKRDSPFLDEQKAKAALDFVLRIIQQSKAQDSHLSAEAQEKVAECIAALTQANILKSAP